MCVNVYTTNGRIKTTSKQNVINNFIKKWSYADTGRWKNKIKYSKGLRKNIKNAESELYKCLWQIKEKKKINILEERLTRCCNINNK